MNSYLSWKLPQGRKNSKARDLNADELAKHKQLREHYLTILKEDYKAVRFSQPLGRLKGSLKVLRASQYQFKLFIETCY
jgi:hypothetical protein